MNDAEFFKFIENVQADAKAMYDNEYYQSIVIPAGFEPYWVGFVHGATMLKTRIEAKEELCSKHE